MKPSIVSSVLSGLVSLALVAGGCSGGNAVKTVRVSAAGKTSNIQRGGDTVAYLLNVSVPPSAMGELHVANSSGVDVKVAGNIAPQSFALSSDGSTLIYSRLNAGGMDAALNWYQVKGGATKTIFATGFPVTPADPTSMTSPLKPLPFAANGSSFSPSGKYFLVGFQPPNVANSTDLHVIETATGNDVFTRPNGSFDYTEVVLPDDTMIFQDSVGGNDGPTGTPSVQTLFWINLPAAKSSQPVVIDTRTAQLAVTGDNKFFVYQRTNLDLAVWDTTARPTTPTTLASNVVKYTVSGSVISYSSTDGSVHVVGVDGTKKLDLAGAGADPFGFLTLSSDGSDVYYFQKVETLASRGTLMHASVSSGATGNKIDDKASLFDVQPLPGALLYLRNVDDLGTVGDGVKSGRDGSGGSALGTGVPIGSLSVTLKGSDWLSPHLTAAPPPNSAVTLVDGSTPTLGSLVLTTASGETKIDPASRLGDFTLSDDSESLVFIGGITLSTVANNYAGKLSWVDTAMPSLKPTLIAVDSVSEITPVTSRTLFANSVSATAMPGVFYVTY